MAKTDYEKVEDQLEEGMRKMAKDKLLEEADAQMPERPKSILERLEEKERGEEQSKKELSIREQAHRNMLRTLKKDIKRLMKRDRSILKELGISPKEVQNFVDDPNALSADQWKKIKAIRDKVNLYKKEMLGTLEEGMNEKIVEEERKKHINKRFNVREGWLPLH